jgi:DNA-binding transcriptional regulator YiaG
LGFNPFTNPALGSPKGNETEGVAFLSAEVSANLGEQIIRHSIKMRKSRQQIAKELGLNPKTVRNWETGRRKPSAHLKKRIEILLRSCPT